ncbi:Scr1 family TA system antitoxin-like transcriptional regulator [Nocardia sp. NPDC005366]|uniref:helix-turn-helix domain-containing protein n=1 Tax=Nocardia sp. NPDC005366 TaxID=3156878 RepID=UPI0033B01D62
MNRAGNDAVQATGSHPEASGAESRARLGAELRRLRDHAGISGRDMAHRVGISQSKLSRIESGNAVPSVPQVLDWAREVDATPETRRVLRRLTEATHSEVDTWRSALESRRHLQDDVRARETAAKVVSTFQPSVVPGLLQTAEYARRVFATFQLPYAKDDLAAALAARLDRQLALYDSERRFEFLVTEAALRLRPGPHRVLLGQLDRISSLSTLGNVSIGVIPLDVQATTTVPHGFVIYDGDEDALVSLELIDASRLVRAPEEIDLYRGCWDLLGRMALFGDDARRFLAELTADIRGSVDD